MDAEGQPALSIHAFDLRRVVRRLIGQCSANLLRRTKSVIVVIYTIRGFCRKDRVSQPTSLETAWTAGLGATSAFQHRPGTAKVRPKRESIAALANHREGRGADLYAT